MSEISPIQLDNLETTGTSRPPATYRKYCRSHCQAELDATTQAYQVFDSVHHTDHVGPLDLCRTGAWFARNSETGKVRVLSSSCKLRWCPMCSATRRWFLTQEVSTWLQSAKKPKFLTLTLAHTSAPLEDQIDHLYKCFRKFRKLKILKPSVRGGVWFFQTKLSDFFDQWHPHLHCVIDSEFISKYDLSAAWAKITVTSNIIDIRTVWDIDNAAQEVARYASRPSMLSKLPNHARSELIESMHGRRLVGTWGSARSITLRPSKPPDSDKWVRVGSWSIVEFMHDHDYRAAALWKAFQTDTSVPAEIDLTNLERQYNGEPKPLEWQTPEHSQIWMDFY